MRLVSVAWLAVALTGCATNFRLQQRFDNEPVGSPPSAAPIPTPPADSMTWNRQFATSVVVGRPSGGRWVQTRRGGTLGEQSPAMALLGISDYFQRPGASVRGHFTVRLSGPGKVWIAVKALQNDQIDGSHLGGYSLENYTQTGTGGVASLQSGQLTSAIEDNSWVAWSGGGTALGAPVAQGQVFDLFWSVDQTSRTLNLGAFPGDTTQVTFPAATRQGVANTPFRRLLIAIYILDFSPDTRVFFDDITIEEL
ncbi:MAG: hypothetical protein KF791_10255 [Verrucomicrobiae bacterium]|nr:hypothetical protein [Verrucomicrobiae bacterium]